MSKYHVAGASVTGASHVARGRSNDDAFAFSQRGQWTAIVVCDGAGSSSRAREGADEVTKNFLSELLTISTALDELGPGPWLNDAVIRAVLNVRASLAELSGTYDLTDFHCTLVAALVSIDGGFTVHIGDGVILSGRSSADGKSEIDIQSNPENGEYANETFFITESTWLKNIRIRPLRAVDWVMLATDGAGSVLMDRDVKEEAISTLFQQLSEGRRSIDFPHIIENYLLSAYSKNCSADDKTLVIAFTNQIIVTGHVDIPVAKDERPEVPFETKLAEQSVQPSVQANRISHAHTKRAANAATDANRWRRIRLMLIVIIAMLSISIIATAAALILNSSWETSPIENMPQENSSH